MTERHRAPAYRLKSLMPRYFFHVQDGEDFIDLQGTILADAEAARREATRFAAALLNDHPEWFWDKAGWTMRVTDADDRVVAELKFAGASGSITDDG